MLEALVAISILMVAVAAPITIAQKGLSSAVFSKDQMIASYLAQDAIEFIKNRRDVATINDENFAWDEFLEEFELCLGSSLTGEECQIDTTKTENNISDHSDNTNLVKDDNGFYQYDDNTGGETKFNRKVVMKANPNNNGNDDEVLITVTVSWGASDDTKLEVKTLIYNY